MYGSKKSSQKSKLFKYKRYWYHLSSNLTEKEINLLPWGNDKGFNRSGLEPDGERICVAPSIEQCITAIPYWYSSWYNIYKTKNKVIAEKPKTKKIFDSHITDEGWIKIPTTFIKMGSINFEDVEKGLGKENVIREAASVGEPRYSGKVLKWWKRAKMKRFIKRD